MTPRTLLAELIYQCITPRVTTMGPCRNNWCKLSARGGGTCAGCLADELAKTIGTYEAAELLYKARQFSNARNAAESAIEGAEK